MIKFFILFFILISTQTSFAFRKTANARMCPILDKDLLAITYEDFLNPQLMAMCSPYDSGQIEDRFNSVEMIYHYNGRPLTPEQVNAVLMRLDQIKTGHGVVRVGSVVEDLLSGKRVMVSGVGTVIQDIKGQGFSILTAAHVISGKQAFVELGGKNIPAQILKIDFEKDLALLSFSENHSSLPLGYQAFGIIGTEFNDVSTNDLITNQKNDLQFHTRKIERWVEADIGLPVARVIVAPWLVPELKSDSDAIDSAFQVPRIRTGMMTAPREFPSGFSGSPILMAYRRRPFSYTAMTPEYSFVIGGVLSLSGDQKTVAASINQIREFLTGPALTTHDVVWYMVGPYFMKWNSASGEGFVYTSPRPIGNGVVVEGETGAAPTLDPKLQSMAARLRFLSGSVKESELIQSIGSLKLKAPVTGEQSEKDWQQYHLKIDLKDKILGEPIR